MWGVFLFGIRINYHPPNQKMTLHLMAKEHITVGA